MRLSVSKKAQIGAYKLRGFTNTDSKIVIEALMKELEWKRAVRSFGRARVKNAIISNLKVRDPARNKRRKREEHDGVNDINILTPRGVYDGRLTRSGVAVEPPTIETIEFESGWGQELVPRQTEQEANVAPDSDSGVADIRQNSFESGERGINSPVLNEQELMPRQTEQKANAAPDGDSGIDDIRQNAFESEERRIVSPVQNESSTSCAAINNCEPSSSSAVHRSEPSTSLIGSRFDRNHRNRKRYNWSDDEEDWIPPNRLRSNNIPPANADEITDVGSDDERALTPGRTLRSRKYRSSLPAIPPPNVPHHSYTSVSAVPPVSDILPKVPSDQSIKDNINCIVCVSTRRSIAFLPCKHVVFCSDCYDAHCATAICDDPNQDEMVLCPICREVIQNTVNLIFS